MPRASYINRGCRLVSETYSRVLNACIRRQRNDSQYLSRKSDISALDNVLPSAILTLNDICAICFASKEHENEDWRQLQCGHAFHCNCLLEWLHRHCHCPLCRKNVDIKTYVQYNL